MLPKLKIHFGSEILEVPQVRALRVITMGGRGDTLKDNIVDLYRLRVAHILKESGQDYNYDNITPKEVEAQLLKDLKEFGSDFVIKQAWDSGYTEVFGDGSYTNDSCISNEDEEYEGIVEHFVENNLPKLEVHFGNEVLFVPQIRDLNAVMQGGKKDTLKDCCIELYKMQVAKKMLAEKIDYNFNDILSAQAEKQLVEDLKTYGSEYVFNIINANGLHAVLKATDYNNFDKSLQGKDELLFKGIVEHIESVTEKENGFRDTDEIDF